MSKKIIIIAILIVLAGIGWRVWATSNPHTWTNGLVGYWSFDGQYTTSTDGTKDVSNNGNYGQFKNGVKPTAGVVGQALSFDGVDDYVNAGNGASLNIIDAITIEAWVKPINLTGAKDVIQKADSTYEPYRLYLQDASIIFQLSQDATTRTFAWTASVLSPGWQHIIATYDKTTVKFYVNGVEKSNVGSTPTYSLRTTTANLYIGIRKSGWTNPFNGLIDEVRIYNRALSADEVKQHYDQTRRNVVINQPSGTPPVGWWKMDEGTGQTVRDYSANANNGTVSNGGYGATSTDGKIGKALSFDGVDDYVSTPLDVAPTAFTLEAWIKSPRTASADDARGILDKRSVTTEWTFWLAPSTGKLRFHGWDSTATLTKAITGNTVLSANRWYHAVITYDGTTAILYVNGNNDGSSSTGNAIQNTASLIRIGTDALDVDRYWDGFIDEVRIYNYARTADQIAADYRAGAYRTIVNTSVPSSWWTTGLVGYWSFDGQYTTSTDGTKDVSNNGNYGQFKNGVKPVAGVVGQALSFDGVDDYVQVSNSAILNITDAITVEAWVYNTRTYGGASYDQIFGKAMDVAYSAYWQQSSGIIVFRLYLAATSTDKVQRNLNANQKIEVNVWKHLVFTYNGSTMKIYVNGSLDNTVNYSGSIGTNADYFGIGKDPDRNYYFTGLIDEVRIYNRALSADEVMQHYQQTRRNLKL